MKHPNRYNHINCLSPSIEYEIVNEVSKQSNIEKLEMIPHSELIYWNNPCSNDYFDIFYSMKQFTRYNNDLGIEVNPELIDWIDNNRRDLTGTKHCSCIEYYIYPLGYVKICSDIHYMLDIYHVVDNWEELIKLSDLLPILYNQ
jgi:hypothetical protein